MKGRSGSLSIILASIMVTAGVSTAFAQTASQILPPDQWELRARTDTFRPSVVLPEIENLNAPAGAEKLDVTLRHVEIVVEDGSDEGMPKGGEQDLKQKIEGKKRNVAEIFAAVQEFERSFVKSGYPLMRVLIPAQELNDGGNLKVLVINGYIESIVTEGLSRYVERRVSRVMSPLVGKKSVTLAEIERRLLLAGDTPGIMLRSTLSAGGKRGGAKLTLESSEGKLVEGVASVVNNMTPQSGRWLGSASVGFNSAFGYGERIQINMAGSPKEGRFGFFGEDPSVRMMGGSAIVPVGNNGLALHADVQSSKALSRSSRHGVPVSGSRFQHLSMALSYPLIRKRDLIMTSMLRFDVNGERVELAANRMPLSEDRMRIVRLSSDTTWFTPWNGIVWGKATASFGLDAFGARSAKDASPLFPLSRQGADARFQKLEAGIGYSHLIKPHLGVDVTAMGQTSFGKPVVNSEQMGLANSSALSTFYSGAIQGDTAGFVRFEVSSPWAHKTGLGAINFKPYIFVAGGIAKLEQPTILEAELIRAASYGAGFVWGVNPFDSRYRFNVALEWGQQLRSDRKGNDDRVNLEVKMHF